MKKFLTCAKEHSGWIYASIGAAVLLVIFG